MPAGSNVKVSGNPATDQKKPNRLWLVVIGIGFLILGFTGLGMTFAVTTASIMLFGVMMIIASGAEFADAAKQKGFKNILYPAFTGLLYLFAGIAILSNPIQAQLILTLIVAGILMLVGLTRVIMALGLREAGGWFMPFISGIISVVLGAMILLQWPVSGLWVIGLVVSVELIVNGWSYIFLGLRSQKA